MRCRDVTRELAAPSGAVDQAELAEHLRTCRACAAWAARARQLERIWSATRPEEPFSEVFQTVWSEVCHRLETEPRPRAAAAPSAWRPWVVGVSGLAAAAALVVTGLIFVGQAVHQPGDGGTLALQNPGPPEKSAKVTPRRIEIEASEGELTVIHVGDMKVVSLPPQEAVNPTMVAADFELLDRFEAMGQ